MSLEMLRQWALTPKLGEAEFDKDGNIKLGEVSLPAREMVTVIVGDSSCQYSLGSIYLQIKDPEQSLMVYRKACKTHQVNDPIKASDKQTVISFFGSAAPTATPGAAAVTEQSAAASAEKTLPPPEDRQEPVSAEKRHERDNKKKRDRHHEKKRDQSKDSRHSSSHDKKRDRSKDPQEKRKEKKAHKTIDPDKLFSNLSVVVGKREIKAQRDAEQAKLHAALSTDGFQVTTEELAKYKAENPNSMVHEIPVGDSSSILKAGTGKDLKRVLTLYNETMSTKKGSSKKSTSSFPASPSKRPYLIGKRPIIILPKGMTAPITMVNAYDFFANSKFVSRDKMQQHLRTTRQQPKTVFSRNVNSRLGGGKVEYELMDNPKSKLHSSKDWERVVAVIALGQSWQMKDWPGPYGKPTELFGRTYGFYVGMEGDKIPTDLQGWSVKQCRLNRDKRGLDSVTYASFWNGLDEWMTIHRPEMLPQLDS
jgi:parafibromin